MVEFSRQAFGACTGAARATLCERLAAELSGRVRAARNFHGAVMTAISELRAQGHDLWSFDEDDDFEVWTTNYARPTGPGLVITFHREEPTEVVWSTRSGE